MWTAWVSEWHDQLGEGHVEIPGYLKEVSTSQTP
jgi:hypothetical protein